MTQVILTKGAETRKVSSGPSLTIAIFGAWPFAFRGMWLWCVFVLLLSAFASAACVTLTGDRETAPIGWLLVHIVFAVIGNKLTLRWLTKRGWTIASDLGSGPAMSRT